MCVCKEQIRGALCYTGEFELARCTPPYNVYDAVPPQPPPVLFWWANWAYTNRSRGAKTGVCIIIYGLRRKDDILCLYINTRIIINITRIHMIYTYIIFTRDTYTRIYIYRIGITNLYIYIYIQTQRLNSNVHTPRRVRSDQNNPFPYICVKYIWQIRFAHRTVKLRVYYPRIRIVHTTPRT